MNWKGQPVAKSKMAGESRRLVAGRGPRGMQLWPASKARAGAMVAAEGLRGDDGGRAFEAELAAYKPLQRGLAAKCKAPPAAAKPISGRAFGGGAQRWPAGPGAAAPRDICRWFQMGGATYVNFIAQAAGGPGKIYTPELESALVALRGDAIARAQAQAQGRDREAARGAPAA